MIESTVVKILKKDEFDNDYIESELSKRFHGVIRWAVVEIDEFIHVSVSYEN